MEPHATRMRKSTDAIQKNKQNDKENAKIFLAVGKYFWAENKIIKARKFIQRAVELDKDFADAWIYLYAIDDSNDKAAA
jgi:Tfp pilus assembly protein PilF